MKQAASVLYRVSILDAAGGLVRALPPKRNLILDQGLDGIAVRSWAASFAVAVVGTGTDPVRRASGAVTLARSGTTVTASAGFFVAQDVGRLIKWDSGEETYVVSFTSGTEVEVADSGTITAGPATVWYVNQTALQTETKRSATYSTDGGANGSTFAAGVLTHKRTFIFSAEVGTVTYREVGWSWDGSPGANLFGRDLLAGAGVTLVAGQQLKIAVELSVAYSPTSATGWTNTIAGWSEDGQTSLEWLGCATVAANGATTTATGDPTRAALDPSASDAFIVVTGDAAALISAQTALPSAIAGQTRKAAGTSAYTAGNFYLDRSATFAVIEGNGAVRSIFIGNKIGTTPAEPAYSVCRVRLDADETKDSNHTLTITFRFSWGRILTN